MIRIDSPGLHTTVQDLGRVGYQRDGVPQGGAMDPFALRMANLLAGNEEGAAALEITLLGPVVRFEREALVALAGAELGAVVDGVEIPAWHAARVPAGATLYFRGGPEGCRSYLAIACGIDVPLLLGSRGTFVRGGFGGLQGRALRAGDQVPIGTPSALSARIAVALGAGVAVAVDGAGVGVTLRPKYSRRPVVRLLPGALAHALTPASRRSLYQEGFRVARDSDRTGYRLDGPRLELDPPPDPLSEPVAFGTVQLPPDGRPIVLMADRQTTGGYPRIAEVATVDLPLLAQLRPGDRLGFRPCSLVRAQALYLSMERGIERARQAISLLHP